MTIQEFIAPLVVVLILLPGLLVLGFFIVRGLDRPDSDQFDDLLVSMGEHPATAAFKALRLRLADTHWTSDSLRLALSRPSHLLVLGDGMRVCLILGADLGEADAHVIEGHRVVGPIPATELDLIPSVSYMGGGIVRRRNLDLIIGADDWGRLNRALAT